MPMPHPVGAVSDIRLAWADLAQAGPVSVAVDWLSSAERDRLARITAPRRAAQFVAGRRIARDLLARHYGEDARRWPISAAEGEPPRIAGDGRPHLSISHAGDLVVCALAGRPVGVDIERLRPQRDRSALLEAIATPEERERAHAALGLPWSWVTVHLWSLKEAWIKLAGGTLLAGMLGRRIKALPRVVSDAAANAATWQRGDMVVALAVDGSIAAYDLPDVDPATVRYWALRSIG